jgi:hypothetical protein
MTQRSVKRGGSIPKHGLFKWPLADLACVIVSRQQTVGFGSLQRFDQMFHRVATPQRSTAPMLPHADLQNWPAAGYL